LYLENRSSDTPSAKTVNIALMEGAEIPAAFGATINKRLQAIIALPLLPQFVSSRGLLRVQPMVLMQMMKNLVPANLPIPLPESGLSAMPADRLVALHIEFLG